MKKTQKGLIIWGVDPFQDSRRIRLNTVSLLRSFTRKNFFDVEPVYISSPHELNVTLEFSSPAATRFQEVALKRLRRFLSDISLPKLLKPRVIVEKNPSITVMTKSLATYAAKQRSSLVVLGTHSRSGAGRLFLGSFAETFLFHSKVPVLLVRQKSKRVAKVQKILFPTDFSLSSEKAFIKLCQLAGQIDASIIICHVNRTPEKIKREAERFLKHAKKLGTSASVMESSSKQGIDEVVLTQAKRLRVDMIGLASQSGQFKTGLFGSVSRKVIRHASTPIWIAHSM